MLKITAIVRSGKIKAVEQALRESRAPGFTYYGVRGHGRETTTRPGINAAASGEFPPFPATIVEEVLQPLTIIADVLPRVKFEIICGEDACSSIVDAIRRASFTGEKGDGIIYPQPVGSAVRIHTGESDEKAL